MLAIGDETVSSGESLGGAKLVAVFTGGGTGGHIFPGLAVADEFSRLCQQSGWSVELHWIGGTGGMDGSLVQASLLQNGGCITAFHAIPCGKLRRYFSLSNFTDLFRIVAGFFASLMLLKKLKPAFVFSKGGFVSVPPCAAAAVLGIPCFTHESDFTPGLATKLCALFAKRVFVSYEETKAFFGDKVRTKCVVTGNPVRPVFFTDRRDEGRAFLGITDGEARPVLLVLGGSLGAAQINKLVEDSLSEIQESYTVVHIKGKKAADENPAGMKASASYKPYAFINDEMSAVLQASDVVLSRAGANSLWECAACGKPMVLIPLEGEATRGDQVFNADYFAQKGAAIVLRGEDVCAKKLMEALDQMHDEETRASFARCSSLMLQGESPALAVAKLLAKEGGL